MKRHLLLIAFALLLASIPAPAPTQTLYKIYKALSGASKLLDAATLTDEDMAEAVSQTIHYMDSQNKVCSSKSDYTIRLKRITKGMTKIDGIPLNFKVYNDKKTANAFAAPDGSVRIYSCLMDALNDNELLGVIGHELGHLAARHSKKAYRNALLLSAARDGLMMDDGSIGDLATSTLGDLGEYMLNAKYSRKQEDEADRYGYQYLKKMGKNPCAMAQALNKLKKLEEGSDNRYVRYVETLFSDHPDISDRVEKLCQMAKADGFDCPICK